MLDVIAFVLPFTLLYVAGVFLARAFGLWNDGLMPVWTMVVAGLLAITTVSAQRAKDTR